jgi:hypothetical protein
VNIQTHPVSPRMLSILRGLTFLFMYEMLTDKASPHAAFYNPKVTPDELPRESIDCRAFVFYIDLPEYPPVVEDIFQIFQTHL